MQKGVFNLVRELKRTETDLGFDFAKTIRHCLRADPRARTEPKSESFQAIAKLFADSRR